MGWKEGNKGIPSFTMIEVEIKHCNEKLQEPNQVVRGQFKDDGFYFNDGGELSWNWDVIRWRLIEK